MENTYAGSIAYTCICFYPIDFDNHYRPPTKPIIPKGPTYDEKFIEYTYCNSKYGIYISSNSDNNIISGNEIYSNSVGIRLQSAKFNIVFKNEFNSNYDKGLYICCGAKDNIIYDNSLINNSKHVDYTVSVENYFYKDGFCNYWDDYLAKYPNATQLNGFWDTPYEIPNSSFKDMYPLVKPINI